MITGNSKGSEHLLMNKYSLVKVAARRARQLQNGAKPLSNSTSMKACRIAQDEIKAGFIGYVLPTRIVEPTIDHPLEAL